MKTFKYFKTVILFLSLQACLNSKENRAIESSKTKNKTNQVLIELPTRTSIAESDIFKYLNNGLDLKKFISREYNLKKSHFYLTLNSRYLYDHKQIILNDLDILKINLKILGGSRIKAMNPDEYEQGIGTETDDDMDSFLPGLNIRVRCNMPGCDGKKSVQRWGFKGLVGSNDYSSNGAFGMEVTIQNTKCRYCKTKIMDSDDDDGDPRIEVLSIVFDRCKFDWKGKIHKGEKKWEKKNRTIVQTEIQLKKENEYRIYYEEDFLDYEYCFVRVEKL